MFHLFNVYQKIHLEVKQGLGRTTGGNQDAFQN